MQRIKGNLQLMKEINTATVLNLLHREGMLSRAEISSITKLSATTVSALVEELIASKMVEEVGERPSVGAGRRAIALQINRKGGYVVGISLGNHALICAVIDLFGDVIAEFKTEIARGNEAIAEQVDSAIQKCFEQASELKAGEIKGIGVSAPGIIDDEGGSVVYSSYLNLSNLNLKSRLESRYPNIPLQIVNDSNAAAFAEHYNGVGRGKSHLIYIYVNGGIGSGLILNGQIFSGYAGGAGEIGHIPVDPTGELCICGKRGCIETVVTTPYIVKRCAALSQAAGTEEPKTMEDVIAGYEASRPEWEDHFGKIATITALMIASAVNFISPESVILDGWMNGSPKFMNKVRDQLRAFPFPIPFGEDRVLAASYGEKGSMYGAATLMLQQIFKATSLS